jgi:RHS repeat-associated protein
MGNRVGLTVGSESYSFTYNPVAAVPAVIVESGGGKTYYYVRDPNGVLIARCEASTPDDYQYYHFDELGSTRLLTDENGDVTDEYAYDAYSATISHVGPTHDNPYQWVGALGYYTHYQSPEFKLIQLGFRFYDPQIGRFTQQDPIGDGLNWYEYCGGNPVGAVDPWGLQIYSDDCCDGLPGVGKSITDYRPGVDPIGGDSLDDERQRLLTLKQAEFAKGAARVARAARPRRSRGSGVDPWSVESMHLLPWQHRDFFRAVGLRISDFTVPVYAGEHRLRRFGGLHTNTPRRPNWNAQWTTFQRQWPREAWNEKLQDPVFQQLGSMLDSFDMWVDQNGIVRVRPLEPLE